MGDALYFPPRELAVMSILWRTRGATVAEVKEALEEPLAYTTVLSALQTLEEKEYVTHESEGRAYRYRATVAAEAAGDSALARVRESIFEGSSEKLFAHFVADEKLSRAELERMRRLLAQRLGDAP